MRLNDYLRTKKVILWLIFWFGACIVFLGDPACADESIKEAQTEESKKNQFVSPDFQLIWNPDGVGTADNIYVLGTRAHLVF